MVSPPPSRKILAQQKSYAKTKNQRDKEPNYQCSNPFSISPTRVPKCQRI